MELWMSMHYAIILFHGFVIGLTMGVIGPSLPELQCLLGIDTDALNYLLLSQGIGSFSCQFVSSLFLTHISPYLITCCCLILCSLSFFILPVSGSIYVTAVAMFVMGGTTEVGLCGLFQLVHRIWAGNERILHLVMASSASGAMLGPLLLNPFLHDGVLTKAYIYKPSTTLENHIVKNLSNTSLVTPLNKYHMEELGERIQNTSQSSKELTCADNSTACSDFNTLIEYPYLIMGTIGIPAIIMELYFYIKPGTHCPSDSYETVDSSNGITNPGNLYFVLMFLFLFCNQGISVAFASLLTTFGVSSSLHIKVNTMSVMTSFFWFIFFIGRMLTVLLPRGYKQAYILCICLLGTLLGSLTLAMVEWLGTPVLWAACALFGLFTAPLVSAGLTWSGQVIAITPKITSFYFVAISCAFMVQFLCGSAMYAAGPEGFVYFCAGISFITLTLHASLFVVIRSFGSGF